MGLVVEHISGRFVPRVVCDGCGKIIQGDPRTAVVVFDMASDHERKPLYTAHKGACHDLVSRHIKELGGWEGWNELGRWFADLLHNTGLTGDALDDALESARLQHEMGL